MIEASGENVSIRHIALIGFGEVGRIFATELGKQPLTLSTYDILCHDPAIKDELKTRAEQAGASLCLSLADALKNADLVISAVTASSAKQVALEAGKFLRPGQVFMDINSVSPATKKADEQAVLGASAYYLEAAVMAPVPPYGLSVPILLGGATAAKLSPVLNQLGFNTRAVSNEVGVASAIKMCRSVMIKGIEALTVECLRAAQQYNAQDEVLTSLEETFPGLDWTGELPHYLISRVAEHGRRRAAEMREVAQTLSDVGVKPLMTKACVEVQDGLIDEMQAAGLAYPTQKFNWPNFYHELSAKKT